MVEGASDNFTKMADKDMKIIDTTKRILMVPCFNDYPSSESDFYFVKKRFECFYFEAGSYIYNKNETIIG